MLLALRSLVEASGTAIAYGVVADAGQIDTPGSTIPETGATRSYAGTVYYIDASGGSDANDGLSPATAWQTLVKVNTISSASYTGEHPEYANMAFLFKRGQTYIGFLRCDAAYHFAASTVYKAQGIVFGAYGTGTRPKIQMAAPGDATWGDGGTQDALYVTVRGAFWSNGNQCEVRNLELDCSLYTTGGSGAFLNSCGAFRVYNVKIADSQYDGITCDGQSGGSIVNAEVLRCRADGGSGAGIAGSGANLTLDHVSVQDCGGTNKVGAHQVYLRDLTSLVLKNSKLFAPNGKGNNGLVIHGTCTGEDIYDNWIDNCNNGFNPSNGYFGTAENIAGLNFYRNLVTNCGQAAGHTQGYAILTDTITTASFYNNVCYNNKLGDFSVDLSSEGTDAIPANIKVYHNSFWSPSTAYYTISINGTGVTAIDIRNNILRNDAATFLPLYSTIPAAEITLDGNQYYAPNRGDSLVANVISATGTAADTFTRADSSTTMGATESGSKTWTALNGTWGIRSNQASCETGAGAENAAVIDLGVSDFVYTVDVVASDVEHPRVWFRAVDLSNTLFVEVKSSTDTVTIYSLIAGSYTSLNSAAWTLVDGTTYAVEVTCSGTSVSIKIGGSSVVSTTTTDHQAATRVGFGMYNASTPSLARFDNLSATTGSGSSTNMTLANLQAAGYETHGAVGDPLYTGSTNLTLQAGSPAKVAVTRLAAVLTDFYAMSRPDPASRGAIEFGISIGTWSVTITESGSAVDSVSVVVVASLGIAETGTASDSNSTSASFSATQAETGSAADAPASALTAPVTQAETASALDSQNRLATFSLTLVETGTAADSQSESTTFAATLNDSGTMSDSQAITMTATVAIVESGGLTDTVATGSIYTLTIAEAGSATATQSTALTAPLTVIETGSATDSEGVTITALLSISDALAALDVVSTAAGNVTVTLSESGSAVDTTMAWIQGSVVIPTTLTRLLALHSSNVRHYAIGQSSRKLAIIWRKK